jgi:Transcriptional regulator, AbiEi antitoxin, Type IV TA system/Transcriptional regulator, AbiEi antitoxin N-terminal domain
MTAILPLLQAALPEGVPVPVRWLHALGVSSALVHVYVRGGWLRALPGQAYLRPGPELTWPAALYAAQQLGLPVHVGHLSALAVHGLTHYLPLGAGGPLHLYLPGRPPVWLAHLPGPVAWHHDALLDEQSGAVRLNPPSLRHASLHLPVAAKLGVGPAPGLPWTVFFSSPERAALELAAGLSRGDSWDTAYETFSGLSMLRPPLVQTLLEQCRRVVVNRLFLHLTTASGHAWLRHVDLTRVVLGTGDRQVVAGGALDPTWRVTVPRRAVQHGF